VPPATRRPSAPGFTVYDRRAWSQRPAGPTPVLPSAEGPGEVIGPGEVAEVYGPLRAVLEERMAAGPSPYVVAVAGGVAVGKSTTARLLRGLLSTADRRVELVATDGFLYDNRALVARGLLEKKGFPETYDLDALAACLTELRAGRAPVEIPVYSHERYDVVPGRRHAVGRADVVVVEGLHLLGPGPPAGPALRDLVDFGIYLDAREADVERWFSERLGALRAGVAAEPDSPLQFLVALDDESLAAVARGVWATTNAVNLRRHIEPTREAADLVLEKGPDHAVRRVRLRGA